MKFLPLLLMCCYMVGLHVEADPTLQYSPVIIVPTITGNLIEAKWNKAFSEFHCPLVSDWTTLWLNPAMVKEKPECFLENFRLLYDNVTRKTSNFHGVQTRIPGWGHTTTVEHMYIISGVLRKHLGNYFFPLVEYLVNKHSYKRGFSIRAAPYDFRKAPNELGEYFVDLKNLVEETYFLNKNRKVVLLGHGSGVLMISYFLKLQTVKWKRRYIKSFVAVSAPYGGVIELLLVAISGGPTEMIELTTIFRDAFRSMPSLAWLLPYDGYPYWWSNEVLIAGPTRNYAINDYRALFDDIGYPAVFQMREDTKNLLGTPKPPMVTVHCEQGYALPTVSGFIYHNWKIGTPLFKEERKGDAVIDHHSLYGCEWYNALALNLTSTWYRQFEHSEILGQPEFLAYLVMLLRI